MEKHHNTLAPNQPGMQKIKLSFGTISLEIKDIKIYKFIRNKKYIQQNILHIITIYKLIKINN